MPLLSFVYLILFIAAEKKQKKKSQISNMNSYLKNTKRRDDSLESDGDGFMDKPIPKKKSMKKLRQMPKILRNNQTLKSHTISSRNLPTQWYVDAKKCTWTRHW